MNEDRALAVFENFKIRRSYDEKAETWYFSVVDIVAALLQQPNYQAARNYWKVLKHRLTKDGSESVTKCNRLKLSAADGKCYLTDVADPETLLRIIQSVPKTGKSVVTGENFLPPTMSKQKLKEAKDE